MSVVKEKEKSYSRQDFPAKKMKVDIVKYRWFWIGFSLAILIPGFIAIGMCFVKYGTPIKLGLDFTGSAIQNYSSSSKIGKLTGGPMRLDSVRPMRGAVNTRLVGG